MKGLRFLGLTAACMVTLTGGFHASSHPFSIPAATPVPANRQECQIGLQAGKVLEFSAADLERRLGYSIGDLRGITVTALPDPLEGILVLEGVEVEPYQFLSRDELDELCFVPGEEAASASLTLQPQGADSTPALIAINVLNEENRPPAVESANFATVRNTRLSGFLTVSDPDGDAVLLKVTRMPEKGDVSISGQSFIYEPFHNTTGSDSFVVCAVDRFGNYSPEATVDISIERNRSNFQYEDMAGNPSAYAAFKLYESEVLRGRQVGNRWYFQPERQVTRGEFLVMVLAAAGLGEDLPATVNTQLERDGDLPLWLKPYIKRALDKEIWDPDNPFVHEQVPTRAEAVQMVALASQIKDVKDYSLSMGDVAAIPRWAVPSYKILAAYRMLDLHDGNAHPDRALDNAYAADLLWQLYKHTHR